MSEEREGWRECADPVELADAVAAGVEVQYEHDGMWWRNYFVTADEFAATDLRYRVPASWSWSYEPPTTVTGDDLPERRVWTCKIGGRVGRLSGGADAPMRRAVADAFTAETGCPVEFCFSGWGDDLDESELAVVEDRAPDPEAIRAALVKRLTALPPPEPPAPVTGDDLRERIARAIYEEEHDGPWKNANHPDWVQSLRSADAVLAVLPPQPVPVTGGDSETPEVKRRTRSEVTDDFVEGTRTIREWVNGGGVNGPRLCEELDAWLDYWGGSPTPTPSPVPPWPDGDDWCGAVLNDLNSIIHQHCGSDGSDDAHCDWVNDLANEVVRYFQRPDVLPAPPPVPSWPVGVLRDAANRLRWIANSGYIEDPGIKRIIRSWADELDATPAPPWPGAVLSGLVDEDGVPTWLAQAGQVRGEQVRRRSDFMWVNNDQMVAHLDTVWVEVRAPRAVPEPETERVPWYRAMGRELVDGLLCVENAMIREVGREGDRVYVCGYEDPDNPDEDDRGDWQRNYWYGRDGFDGTVEVLVEAGQ